MDRCDRRLDDPFLAVLAYDHKLSNRRLALEGAREAGLHFADLLPGDGVANALPDLGMTEQRPRRTRHAEEIQPAPVGHRYPFVVGDVDGARNAFDDGAQLCRPLFRVSTEHL